jgi:hypothetical protein
MWYSKYMIKYPWYTFPRNIWPNMLPWYTILWNLLWALPIYVSALVLCFFVMVIRLDYEEAVDMWKNIF